MEVLLWQIEIQFDLNFVLISQFPILNFNLELSGFQSPTSLDKFDNRVIDGSFR